MEHKISELDEYLFNLGRHYDIYEKLGAHKMVVDGEAGVYFAVVKIKTRFYILYRNGFCLCCKFLFYCCLGGICASRIAAKTSTQPPISRRESCSPSSSQPAKTEKTDSILKMMEAKITLTYF